MHKSTLKVLALSVLTLALAVFLGACGSSDNAAETETNANVADVMQAAQEKLDSVSSMSYNIKRSIDFNDDSKVTMRADGDIIVNPMTMKVDVITGTEDKDDVAMQFYAVEENGKYTIYTVLDDDDTGKMSWSKSVDMDMGMGMKMSWGKTVNMDDMDDMDMDMDMDYMDDYMGMDTLKEYQAKDNMNIYLNAIDSFEEAGIEKVHDSEATRYDGIITNDSLYEVMADSGMWSGLSYDEAEMKDMCSQLGDLPISIWIDNESGMPVQCHMDTTKVIQMVSDMTSTDEDADFTVNSATLDITLYNFDGVDSIEIPEEALNAGANE